jgi:D-erythronate 2-dehydrogenase
MPIVVTGAGGFVGRRLMVALHEMGHETVAVDYGPLDGVPASRSVQGDIADASVRAEILRDGCTALVHLATVPGGAAEADPAAAQRINIDATQALLEAVGTAARPPRVVFASSIAVYGAPLPAEGVDDQTPLSPHLIYGAHKAMMEIAVALWSNRGRIDGISLRLPAILARPRGAAGMKSAFMSDMFHALRGGQPIICPVSRSATIWAQSLDCCVGNLLTALSCDIGLLPPTRAVTLPALTIGMGDLVHDIARQCDQDSGLVTFEADAGLELAFGAHPALSATAAERLGFAHDGSVATLVARALATLD